METEKHVERLRRAGLVPTAQRLAVLAFLDGNGSHPSAEEIHVGVSRHVPSISRATVYNTLEALKSAGTVAEVTIDRRTAHYDPYVEPHPHFLCEQCGRLYDVELPCAIRPGDTLLGHRVHSVQTNLYGTCRDCQGGKKRAG